MKTIIIIVIALLLLSDVLWHVVRLKFSLDDWPERYERTHGEKKTENDARKNRF